MYEDLMIGLDLCARGEKTGYHDVELCGLAYAAIKSLTAQLAALRAENAELKKRVEAKEAILRLYETTLSLVSGDKNTAIHCMRKAESALSRVEAERDAAVEFIKWIDNEFGNYMPVLYHNRYVEWRGAQGEG